MRERDQNERNERGSRRGFFGRLIVGLLSLMAFLGLMAMAMSVLSSYIDPSKFVWASFFGLAFWEILLFNVIIFVLLLMMWSRKTWIAVLALLVAVPGIMRSFSNGKAHDGGDIRIMSYNVQIFHDLYDSKKKTLDVVHGVVEMVRENHPDVLCIQEFGNYMTKTSRSELIRMFGEFVEMPYHYYHKKAYFGGNVIFSKYPVSAISDNTSFGNENDYGAVAQIDAGVKGKFLVVCSHLTSFRLTKEELSLLSEPGNTKEEVQEYGKSIVVKLRNAYRKRSRQVNELLADIPHDGRPILLCGDFNDTPLSYTYHQIKKAGFTDGFVETGKGIGHTYAGKLPLLRIDYIWCNEQIQPMRFKRLRFKGSDHYPVMLDFKVNHGI